MKPKNWKIIQTEQDVLNIIEQSEIKPQVIFKDSISCGISAFAKDRLISGNNLIDSIADFNYLDLLSYRSVSNFIASKLEVIHQSPQIIIIIDKKVVFRDSHHSIEPKKIAEKINDLIKK